MKTSSIIISALVAASLTSPAMADDAAMDVESMIEQSAPKSYQAITPAVGSFDIANIAGAKKIDFMATMTGPYDPGFRLNQPIANFETETEAGLTSFIVPQEFSYRSSEQDSGVDAVTPGQYLSRSIRSDYLSEASPAAKDKSSFGVKFGF